MAGQLSYSTSILIYKDSNVSEQLCIHAVKAVGVVRKRRITCSSHLYINLHTHRCIVVMGRVMCWCQSCKIWKEKNREKQLLAFQYAYLKNCKIRDISIFRYAYKYKHFNTVFNLEPGRRTAAHMADKCLSQCFVVQAELSFVQNQGDKLTFVIWDLNLYITQ